MKRHQSHTLSARERQILDILYQRGGASVATVHGAMTDPPSYDAVRTTLRILEEKGFVRHSHDGPRYIYHPIVPQRSAQREALKHLVETFFQGSVEKAVVALLRSSDRHLTKTELDELESWIKQKGTE